MKGESLKGHLDLLILAVLAEAPGHGYSVIEELRARSGDVLDLAEGTVYPARLESTWTEVNGRRRRTYQLTTSGRAKLIHERSTWEQFATAVGSVLGRKPWPIMP